MKVQNLIPHQKIVDYVDKILMIENNDFLHPFILPLYANGVPAILFQSVKGKLGNCNSNHLTLFGQTISPTSLTLNNDFILIAYFLKPYSLISLFGVQGFELTDNPIDLNLLSPQKTICLEDQLLNCKTIGEMILKLDDYIFELINSSKGISDNIKFVSENLSNFYDNESIHNVQNELKITERTLQRIFKTTLVYRQIHIDVFANSTLHLQT